jgi:hypothetical protein
MSAPMTLQELGDLIKFVHKNNCPFGAARMVPIIKYIDPHIDNRDGKCFSITFRGFGTDHNFSITNEHISNPKSLLERCMHYATTGNIT